MIFHLSHEAKELPKSKIETKKASHVNMLTTQSSNIHTTVITFSLDSGKPVLL